MLTLPKMNSSIFWKDIVAKHELVNNKWVTKTYVNKSMWATTYFCDHFFARIRTMSRCESMNTIVKLYVKRTHRISQFVESLKKQ